MVRKFLDLILGETSKPDMINNSYAKATTPDRLIAAHIIESFTLNFEDWDALNLDDQWRQFYDAPKHTLTNTKKGLSVGWENQKKSADNDNRSPWVYKLKAESAHVRNIPTKDNSAPGKSVPLDAVSSRLIIESWDKVSVVKLKAKAVADKALAEMKANEAAWTMAENLLGMKRNKFGALVPVKTAE